MILGRLSRMPYRNFLQHTRTYSHLKRTPCCILPPQTAQLVWPIHSTSRSSRVVSLHRDTIRACYGATKGNISRPLTSFMHFCITKKSFGPNCSTFVLNAAAKCGKCFDRSRSFLSIASPVHSPSSSVHPTQNARSSAKQDHIISSK